MPKQKIHLTTIAAHESFTDCILSCERGLRTLGYDVDYSPGLIYREATNILFCSQMVTWKVISSFASQIIIYNWEPASPLIGRFPPGYIRQMINAHVWDYSLSNVVQMKAAGVQDIHHVPMVYVDEMSRVPVVSIQDIDVLFYGEINPRRRNVIDAIRAKGLNVITSDDTGPMSGEQRDAYIARAKVVLNIHLFENAHVFEIARAGYLLANNKAVVTELSEYTEIEDDIRSAVAHGSIEELPQLCWDLVHDHDRRHELERLGFEIFSKRQAKNILKPAIERYFDQLNATPPLIGNQPTVNTAVPKTIKISPGVFWNYTYCNIDGRANFAPDLPIDISKPLPLGETLKSWRFGDFKCEAGYFNKIIAENVFQRVDDLELSLTNCLTLLEDGGTVEITIPLDLSFEAWAHIDDKRAFNENTWARIIDDWWRYGWTTHRFEIAATGVGYHNSFAATFLAENNNDWGKAIRTPRIMDIQNITLRKRALTDEEKLLLPQVRFLD